MTGSQDLTFVRLTSLTQPKSNGTEADTNIPFPSNKQVDRLIEYGFAPRSRIFPLYRYVAVVSEGMQNVGLNSVLLDLEQEVSLSCPAYHDKGRMLSRSHMKNRLV